jgi:hypothetical protein
MFKYKIFILIVAVALITGCIPVTLTGSGNVATQEEPITR